VTILTRFIWKRMS